MSIGSNRYVGAFARIPSGVFEVESVEKKNGSVEYRLRNPDNGRLWNGGRQVPGRELKPARQDGPLDDIADSAKVATGKHYLAFNSVPR